MFRRRSRFGLDTEWIIVPLRPLKLILLGLLAGALVWGGLSFYWRLREKIEAINAPPKEVRYARLVEVMGEVEVKKVNSLAWLPARRIDQLEEGDLIRTGSGSAARVIFFNGTSYEIGPNALATVMKSHENPKTREQRVGIELAAGKLALSTSEKNVPGSSFEVATEVATASFDERTEARAQHEGGESEFSVLRGGAEVTTRGLNPESRRLASRQVVTVDANRRITRQAMLPVAPRLRAPKNFGLFVAANSQKQDVKLSWEKVPDAKSYRLQVSPSASFKDGAQDLVVRGKESHILNGLNYGTYYWRVMAIDGRGLESEPSEVFNFTIIPKAFVSDKPHLEVVVDKVLSFGRSFEVIGRATPGAVVFINDEVVEVKGDGSFKHFTHPLPRSGRQELIVVARDLTGASKLITIPVEVK